MSSKDSKPQDPSSPSSDLRFSRNVIATTAAAASSAPSTGITSLPTKLAKWAKPKRLDYMNETRLGDDYEPQPCDVICSRRKEISTHPGNVRFHLCVQLCLDRYIKLTTRHEKTIIVKEILDAVRDRGGKFIKLQNKNRFRKDDDDSDDDSTADLARKQNERAYFDIGNKRAADKISHALRFAVSQRRKNTRRQSWPSRALDEQQNNSDKLLELPLPINGDIAQDKIEHDSGKPLALEQDRKTQATLLGFAQHDILNTGIAFSTGLPPLVPARTNRRQSWNGFVGDSSNNNNNDFVGATAEFETGFSTPSDDGSLSSGEWNLSSLQNKQANDDDDVCSFGSLPSGTTELDIQDKAILEPLQLNGAHIEEDMLVDEVLWDHLF